VRRFFVGINDKKEVIYDKSHKMINLFRLLLTRVCEKSSTFATKTLNSKQFLKTDGAMGYNCQQCL